MAPYIISINNQSSSKQSYAIFAATPTIKRNGNSAVSVATRIITSVRGVASPQGQASFMLSKKLFATCGVYDVEADTSPQNQHRKRIGTGIEVVDQRPVVLGCKDEREDLFPEPHYGLNALMGHGPLPLRRSTRRAILAAFAS
ncbi:hypothetical protein FIE12Z_9479 [Fusarium flagelliforme]|uniref:Uncharacterized protein n=1 Tax=Fusarium flagelliforme TaxID=2675880 RepID=A0A395MEB9_9HYPO|nr:hypothetical protein FIE12Z_9479 [Fusarium flagelliforme]